MRAISRYTGLWHQSLIFYHGIKSLTKIIAVYHIHYNNIHTYANNHKHKKKNMYKYLK